MPFFTSNTLSIVYDNYHLELGVTPGILFKKILSTQWLFIVFGGVLVVIVTLFLTHRIAGPFFRFEKSLDEMIDGDVSQKINLREKDEGKALAQKINAFNFVLSDKLSLIENFNSNIEISVHQMKKKLKDADIELGEIESYFSQILDNQKNVQTMINDYTFFRGKL